MADITNLDDILSDIYETVLGNEYPINWVDQEDVPELNSNVSTYVDLEIENLEQIGNEYNYSVTNDAEGNTFRSTKTEWEFQFIFTAHGPDADKAIRLIGRSKDQLETRYLLTNNNIALRRSSGITRLPRVAGGAIEKGATITFTMGVADMYTEEIPTIDSTVVEGIVPITFQNHESDLTVDTQSYFSRYGYEIDTVFKDYHSYTNEYNHIINLGSYLDSTESDNVNDGGSYPIL